MKRMIDWAAVEQKACGMTDEQLRFAIRDIQATLPNADRMDRESNGTTGEGGYYRDEASVYHRELARRRQRDLRAMGDSR